MIRSVVACSLIGLMVLPAAATAQVLPRAESTDPRLQTIGWIEAREVTLTAMPRTGLTVMFEPGEKVVQVAIEDEQRLTAQISAQGDSILLLPQSDLDGVRVRVRTDRRSYPFRVHTENSLLAAYLVRFTYGGGDKPSAAGAEAAPAGNVWTYRLKGDRSVFPLAVSDDGSRTSIAFADDQSLPAIFAIGPTGEEEAVNGYMRGDLFVIDRVYPELVFRIGKDNARAVRAASAGGAQ